MIDMSEDLIKNSYNIQDIIKILPHRYPFVLIDRIDEVKQGEYVNAIKNVTINEPFFGGHFPKNPVMPGVLIVESMAQTAAVFTLDNLMKNDKEKKYNVYFMTIDNVKFRKMVLPGDTLKIDVSCIKQRDKIAEFTAIAYVEKARVAEASFKAMISLQ